MNRIKPLLLFVLVFIFLQSSSAQNSENWSSKQLIEPSDLAQILERGNELPLMISVGPGATIPHSKETGMAKEPENLEKFKKELSAVRREHQIVIYCGCCPFDNCPNVRPAIAVLKDMGFTNYKLLNLPHNIKADWIDKGYPVHR